MNTRIFLFLELLVAIVVVLNGVAWTFYRRPGVDFFEGGFSIWGDVNKYLSNRGAVLARIARAIAVFIFLTWGVVMLMGR
jgi:hypothetical protein